MDDHGTRVDGEPPHGPKRVHHGIAYRLLKDPLLHFLLLGGALFGIDAWTSQRTPTVDASKRIEVTAGHLEQMRAGYRRQFQRLPDEQELRGLITAHLHEEVLYREALALGLDREDSIVRRRLAQKMEFLTGDLAQAAPPDDVTLARFFSARATQYALPGRVTFQQVFFSAQKRGDQAEAESRAARAALAQGASEDTLGDGFLHGFDFAEQTADDLTALFGGEFTTQLMATQEGVWAGPLRSSYGLHLVRISSREPGQPVALALVRERVLRDFHEDQRLRANQALVEQLQQRYVVTIDETAVRSLLSAAPPYASSTVAATTASPSVP